MTLQDIIGNVYKRQAILIEEQDKALAELRNITDKHLAWILSEAVRDMYVQPMSQCRIEIEILEKAQQMIAAEPAQDDRKCDAWHSSDRRAGNLGGTR